MVIDLEMAIGVANKLTRMMNGLLETERHVLNISIEYLKSLILEKVNTMRCLVLEVFRFFCAV